ncbi:PAB-dependent poly(A)-specific ribonuclease subunit 3 [Umbelopsis nana]
MQNQNALGEIILPSQSTSAIPIVAPPADAAAASATPKSPILKNSATAKPAPGGAAKRLCRNIIIHGYCKFEGKGCEFNHEVNKPAAPKSPEAKPKLRVNSPAFKPSTPSSVSADAPVFVPKAADASLTSSAAAFQADQAFDPNVRDYVPNTPYFPPQNQTPSYTPQPNNVASLANNFSQFGFAEATPMQADMSPMAAQATQRARPFNGNMFDSNQMDPYYYSNPQIYPQQPLQHHLYSTPLPHVTNLHPHQKSIHAFFMSDNLREELTERNEALLKTAPDLNLPQELHVYHSLYPLDYQQEKSTQVFGHPTSVYKAMCTLDGRTYALRRIEGFRLMNEMAMSTIENWRRIRHANVVSVREAFTTKAFGDHSLIFVYDYHPCSTTLFQAHFSSEAQQTGGNISEKIIWSYITQITSALKAIHSSGLAARVIEPTKILLTGKNRIRLNCCGALDTIKYDGGQNLARFQQEDLLAFGKLVVALACNSLQAIQNLPNSFEYISHFYSPDLKNLILYLLSKPMPTKSIDEVISLIGPKILHEIDSAHHHSDFLESELSRELENGRLFRLLMKINFINERPEFDMDPSWSETGDRYIIKLFRDYVFHQVNENGAPAMDMVHVLTCLNKLDVGVDEKIMLMSRDEQSCLIVSYKEIKNCIISAFNDLRSGRK